jgi:hypothetical protein
LPLRQQYPVALDVLVDDVCTAARSLPTMSLATASTMALRTGSLSSAGSFAPLSHPTSVLCPGAEATRLCSVRVLSVE